MWTDDLGVIADLLPIGLIFLDTEGRIAGANGLGLSFLGLDERMIGRADFVEALDAGPLRQALSAPATGPVMAESRVGNRVLHADLRPLPEGGRIVSLRDVTALAGASQIRRNIVGEILHRLRTRLTTVLSALSLGSSGRISEKEKLTELLDMGRREAERLSAFLGRLRDLFLVETGAILDEVAIQPLRLSEVLGRVVRGFRPRFLARGQLVAEDYATPEYPVLADPELLARSFVHVLRNAHVHTPDGTWVKVRTSTTPEEGIIEVSDNGPGVPPEELPNVFQCFRGAGHATGEGLGLYLSRQLLLAQNGTIRLDSRPGGGTTVTLHIGGTGASR
ncbi:MAG: PAS domain-containing sensor histidine kinase [Planctomycetes bacterium]|nr:PAS domain-containing sensor histidine kinase [Planctomycetota bacterium]